MKRGFSSTIVILLLVLVTLVVFLVTSIKKRDQDRILSKQTEIDQLNSETNHPKHSLLQKALIDKCKPLPDDEREFINLEDLPITINESLVKVEVSAGPAIQERTLKNIFMCLWGNPGKNYALSEELVVYDKSSEELGHGGPPYFGLFGKEIENKEGIKIGARLDFGEGPAAIKSLSVWLRGEKEIELNNGEKVFVSADEILMEGGTPKLVEFLKKYSRFEESYSEWQDGIIIDEKYSRDEIENEFVKQFFVRAFLLDPKEKENLARLSERLKAIKAR